MVANATQLLYIIIGIYCAYLYNSTGCTYGCWRDKHKLPLTLPAFMAVFAEPRSRTDVKFRATQYSTASDIGTILPNIVVIVATGGFGVPYRQTFVTRTIISYHIYDVCWSVSCLLSSKRTDTVAATTHGGACRSDMCEKTITMKWNVKRCRIEERFGRPRVDRVLRECIIRYVQTTYISL